MLGLVVDVTRGAVAESMFEYSFASNNKVLCLCFTAICSLSISTTAAQPLPPPLFLLRPIVFSLTHSLTNTHSLTHSLITHTHTHLHYHLHSLTYTHCLALLRSAWQVTVAMMPGLGLYLFELFFDRYHSKLDTEGERLDLSKKRKAEKIEEESARGGTDVAVVTTEKGTSSTDEVVTDDKTSGSGSGSGVSR